MTRKLSPFGVAAAAVVAASAAALAPSPLLAQGAERVAVAIGHRAGGGGTVRAEVARAGGRVLHDLSAIQVLEVELPARAAAALARHASVDFVETPVRRDPMGQRSRRAVPTAAGVITAGESVPYGITMVQADQLSEASAAPRTLCIVDSGIDATHEDFAGVTLTGTNFTQSGSWNTDENSHGTHVAGTIAARANGLGVVGVAPAGKLSLHIAKVFAATGGASSTTIARAMLDCRDRGAHVVSMSLGGGSASRAEQRAATALHAAGILTIAAAGNDGTSAVSYPAGFAEVISVAAVDSSAAPASFSQFNADVELAAPGVAVLSTVPPNSQIGASLSVGDSIFAVQGVEGSPLASVSAPLADFGLGDTRNRALSGKVCLIQRGVITFADKVGNCQRSGGVAAVIVNNEPGALSATLGTLRATIPVVGAAQADNPALQALLGSTATPAVFTLPDRYAAYDGTSMATPHVSGVAALVWSLNPGCTAAQLRNTLARSAFDLGAPGRDANTGHGLVQAKAAHQRIASLGCGN